MSEDKEPAALAYIEKTLADSYRKEIDQEENVWRTLPFFAATLALELAALFQMIDKLADPATVAGKFSVLFLGLAGLCTLLSLGFLAASIYPQKFDYVAKETDLLTYAKDLIAYEQAPENQEPGVPFSAVVTLKTELARQYAESAVHNRRINKQRELRRSIAGLSALGSVLTTVFLVATTYMHYMSYHVERDTSHEPVQVITAGQAAKLGAVPPGNRDQPAGSGPAAHASGH